MVVDDDPNARDLLAATVRREGYRVIEATDGEAALALAREWHPDVVTLDVLMPRMDGWAVLTALKSDPELAVIPVIIVTVLADRGIAVSLGAAEFLTKPIDRARLAATIRQHVYGSGVVLVVDDEDESRSLARRHLDRLGWEVAEAEDGAGALLWLSQNPRPAMILLDLVDAGHERLRLSRRDRQARRVAGDPDRDPDGDAAGCRRARAVWPGARARSSPRVPTISPRCCGGYWCGCRRRRKSPRRVEGMPLTPTLSPQAGRGRRH